MRFPTLTLLGALALSATLDAETFDPTRLVPTVLQTGLNRPMVLKVAPDGRIFYLEIEGRLMIHHPSARTTITAGEIKVTTAQENGLIGLVLDPDFANNQWIYLAYSPPDFPGQHISRFTMKGDVLDLSSEKLLLKFEEQRLQCCHHAGSLAFGPDGCLYISAGDNTHPGGDSRGYAPIDERPERMPWDAQKSASNIFSHNGKVLRIKPKADGTYEIPDGNLFPKDGAKGLPEIYVMGCRNPWRISVDPKSGFLYWGDVGPDAGGDNQYGPRGYDEVNQARKAGNFGWPYFVGPNLAYPDVDFATNTIGKTQDPNAPENRSPNSKGVQILPPVQPAFVYWHGGASEKWPLTDGSGRTACAGPVYHYDPNLKSETKFPEHFDNTLFFYEWSRHWINLAHLDAKGDLQEMERFMPGYPFVRPIDMTFGPEGALYLIEYGETWGKNDDAKLVRIDYIRGNRAPRATAKADNTAGKAPLEVKFTSEGTGDLDAGDAISYAWTIVPGDGKVVSTEANPTLKFEMMGTWQAALTVTDSHGAQATTAVPVMVGNSRPQVTFATPRDGDFFDYGKPVNYEIAVKDEEDTTPAVDRIALMQRAVKGTFQTIEPTLTAHETLPPGLELMKRSDCFNCHTVDRRLVGPSYQEVALKYKGDATALELSAKRILEGSSNVWGPVPMMPHPQHNKEQAKLMVGWILSLATDQKNDATQKGAAGKLVAKQPQGLKSEESSVLLLEASYLDGGMPPIAPLAGTQTIRLRHSKVHAEESAIFERCRILGTVVGAIDHDAILRFPDLNLAGINQAVVRVASAGAGGVIEFRAGKKDGPLLGSVAVEKTGGWDKWVELPVSLQTPSQRGDLYVVFVNPGKGGLMNLDWVHFKL